MPDFHIKRNDTLPAIRAVLSDAAGAIDLTGAVVRFYMAPQRSSVLTVDAEADIEDEADGLVRYDWEAGDTAVAGVYHAEWEVTFGDNSKLTFPNDGHLRVVVTADIGEVTEPPP
jgi:hypothetical protein